MTTRSSLFDTPNSFGWISIALHWASAAAIILLWFIGMSIEWQASGAIDARRTLHITLGLVLWLPLAGRILWRCRVPHPRAAGQTQTTHKMARLAHYVILLVLGVMLVSGPLMAWTLGEGGQLAELLHVLHANAAIVLAVLVSLHILGALKHLMFHDDETIARIFVPRKPR